jgi:hypothetical protein
VTPALRTVTVPPLTIVSPDEVTPLETVRVVETVVMIVLT